MEQTRAATARAEALERQVSALQAAQARDAQRISALEGQLAAERGRREQAERDRAATSRDLSAARSGVGDASAALATGSSDVSRDLAQAQAAAADVAQRAANGSPEQSAAAAAAQHSLAASRQALAEGDLFRARAGLSEAQQALSRAQATSPGAPAH